MTRYNSQACAPAGDANLISRFILLLTMVTSLLAAGNSMAASQTISMAEIAGKTYGDAPFTVVATASSGLPITQWESSDPSVASISSSGLVTLVGAGQTSIIATNAGNTNYSSAWIARPLNVSKSSASLPSGTQAVTYNGSPQGLNPGALPSGQATEITYRNTSVAEAAPTPQVVFQNGPDTLDLSYFGTGLQAVGYWGMAKYVSLGGTARKLESCDVTLVSWARYDTSSPNGYLSWANAHPNLVVPPPPGPSTPGNSGGYYHPVTLAFYDYENDGVLENYRLLTSMTVQALIPWRPTNVGKNTTYPYSGTAFRVQFSFPDGIILPSDVWVAVSYNTNTFGTAPVGSPGPYDSLNVSHTSGQQVGSTLLSSTLLFQNWRWQSSSGNTGPMLRLRAIPTLATPASPSNAGLYVVKTQANAFGSDPHSTSFLQINKAPLVANLTNLTQIRDGSPKSVTVTTTPVGISTSVSYAGSPDTPSTLGSYQVVATSVNPNYEGQVSGILQIGDIFSSWQIANFSSSGLPLDQITDIADPDGDGLSNFLEYTFNLNPTGPDYQSTTFGASADTCTFTYRRNLNALDLEYSIENSTELADPDAWSVVTPISQIPIFDDGSTRIITATVARPAAQPTYFLRLRARR